MKKICNMICSLMLIIILGFSSQSTFALNTNPKDLDSNAVYQKALNSKGFYGTYKTEDLYNQNDVKQWRMFYDDNSYLILDRGTGEVIEFGYDGKNPYYENKEAKLYYCGPLAYFVESLDKSNKKFYRIGENKYYDTLPKEMKGIKSYDTEKEITTANINIGETHDISMSIEPLAGEGTLISEVYLDSRTIVQDYAFRYNLNGTCTAVATGIVLTYLNKTRSPWYVPSPYVYPQDYRAEMIEYNYDFNSTSYQNAERLHQLLVSSGMPTATYGQSVSNAIYAYRSNYLSTALSVEANSWNNDPTYITNQIDIDIPGMITTFLDYYEMGYSFHTMAVYGYRKYVETSIITVYIRDGGDPLM